MGEGAPGNINGGEPSQWPEDHFTCGATDLPSGSTVAHLMEKNGSEQHAEVDGDLTQAAKPIRLEELECSPDQEDPVQSHRHPRNLAYAYPSPFEQDFTRFLAAARRFNPRTLSPVPAATPWSN